MAVVTGTTILASEFNTLRTAVNRVFADNYAGSISFGNSNQTYGWGGAAAAAAAGVIDASELNALTHRVNIGSNIVNVVSGTLSDVVTGTTIQDGEYNLVETKIGQVTTYRNNIEAAELSTANRGSSVRSTTWSGAIDATFRFTFTDFDDARYFFNSGGAFYIYGTISGYSTGTGWDGAGFNQIFTNMGTVTMDYANTVQSGSGGTPSSFGYYNLGTGYTNIFNQTGTGAYTDATLYLAARRSTSGNYIELRVTLTPEAGRSVNGTTTVYVGQRKLNNQSYSTASLTITQPSYSLIDGF